MDKLLLFPLFLLLACQSNSLPADTGKSEATCNSMPLSKIEALLGKNLKELNGLDCYEVRDTVMVADEDDSMTWNAKYFYYKNQLAFIAEANWQNTSKVYMLTIYSPSIRDGVLYVGQQLKDFTNLVPDELTPTGPDGYLFLPHKQNSRVHIEMDISELNGDSVLYYGVNNKKQIPADLRVTSIVIRK